MLDELDRANTGPTSERIWAATTGWHTIGHRIRTVAEVDIGLPDVVEHLVPLAGRDVRRAVLGNTTTGHQVGQTKPESTPISTKDRDTDVIRHGGNGIGGSNVR